MFTVLNWVLPATCLLATVCFYAMATSTPVSVTVLVLVIAPCQDGLGRSEAACLIKCAEPYTTQPQFFGELRCVATTHRRSTSEQSAVNDGHDLLLLVDRTCDAARLAAVAEHLCQPSAFTVHCNLLRCRCGVLWQWRLLGGAAIQRCQPATGDALGCGENTTGEGGANGNG